MDVRVNLLTQSADVDINPTVLKEKDIVKLINGIGN